MEMKRKNRYLILVLLDLVCLFACAFVASWLVLNSFPVSLRFWLTIGVVGLLQVGSMAIAHVYRIRLASSSLELLTRIMAALIPASFVGFFVQIIWIRSSMTLLRFGIVYYVFSFVLLAGYRIMYRLVVTKNQYHGVGHEKTVIIYGAGEIGCMLVRQANKGKLDFSPIGFVDDNPQIAGTLMNNVPVLGNINSMEAILQRKKPRQLIIAITDLSSDKMQQALHAAKKAGVEVQIIPSLFEMNQEGKQSADLRAINYEDLLGRQMITIDRTPIEEMVKGRRVLVTGAGGSIGSEICTQLKGYHPSQLLLLDIDETELHDLSLRLHGYQKEFSDDIFPICCDIKNKEKIDRIFAHFQPEIVFHAAAYKHVPMMEYYPEEAIRTNIAGSFNVLHAAVENHVRKVIVISTDKAVNPTNVMGATKRCVELEASLLTCPETEIVCVRFGNVLGSRGSMLPLFLEQIRNGMPLTVTHKDIIRYFMTIPEAVSLVFLAGAMAKGGEVMVLDMGEPVRIYDFAQKLITYFGDGRSQVIVTGLRPGEKLYEELLADKDLTIPTSNKKVFKAKVTGSLDPKWLDTHLKTIHTDSVDVLLQNLSDVLPEFKRQGNAHIVDAVRTEK